MQTSLNNGEAVNSLAHALFFGRHGVMRDRAFEDQMHRASCLVLLIAAIAVWNTVYLDKALETYQSMQGKRSTLNSRSISHRWDGTISISWAGTTSRTSGSGR